MLVFSLFLSMLATIALGQWLGTHILANLVGLASITGLLIFYFRNPEAQEAALGEKISHLTREQKKQWYGLFAIGLFFSLLFGSFWNTSMGGL